MTALTWDQTGERIYEAGIDRGVLYMPEGNGIAWNGLLAVNETVTGNTGTSVYFDGIKYANVQALGEFTAALRAYTYPDEFEQFEGTLEVGNGLFVANQHQDRFGLTYRTKIGDDEDGIDLGYKIHILYNVTAVPSAKNYQTLSDTMTPIEFEWNLTAIPGDVPSFQATAHLIIDSRKMGPLILETIEDTLYGNEVNDARLPPLSTLVGFIGSWVIIKITDNLNGTWTAEGPDNLITMLDATTFQITQANAIYLDADTYVISDTTY